MAAFLDAFATVLLALIGLVLASTVLLILATYLLDVQQHRHAIRRNFPVFGRFRYLLEHIGEFLRQYFFAMDREELPFNRADRSWIYRAAKDVDNTQAFGSTKPMSKAGELIFVNSPYPSRPEQHEPAAELVFGPNCPQPYRTRSFYNISAMSFGAISQAAVTALSNGARLAGCWMNTGEGGLSPYHRQGGGDIVFQIGTAKYGVRNAQGQLDSDKLAEVAGHDCVKMFEIKLSQGAKPGKGGILPAAKVTAEIAQIRGIPQGQDSLSPCAHEEVDSVEALLDFIAHIRQVTGKPVGFKAVISDEAWLQQLCHAIRLRGVDSAPDFITLDSGDGGTGAAPASLIDSMGLNLKESLPMLVDSLVQNGLRDRIKVICSGKMVTPSWVAWALAMGADAVNSARGFMFALGCIQSLKCNQNSCPTGIATQDRRLQRGLDVADKMHRVQQYQQNLSKEVELIAHSCGVPQPRALRRHHVRMVLENGMTELCSSLYPDAQVAVDTESAAS